MLRFCAAHSRKAHSGPAPPSLPHSTPPPLCRRSSTAAAAAAAAAIAIRPATAADAPAIRALGTAVFSATFRASGCTAAQLQAYLAEAYTPAAVLATLTSPDTHHTLVAHHAPAPPPTTTTTSSSSSPADAADAAADILGFALLRRGGAPDPAVTRAGVARPAVELQRLYVAEAAHGRGVGTALMRAAERAARGMWGARTVWLGVWEGNAAAKGLYMGKLGFRHVGEHVFDVGGDEQTDWVLVKEL